MNRSILSPGDDPLKLLIAEDRPEIQVLMKRLMDMWGHSVDIVSNGLEAVEHAGEGGPTISVLWTVTCR